MKTDRSPEPVADILSRLLRQPSEPPSNRTNPTAVDETLTPPPDATDGRYDFDLAEFPLFRLNKLATAKSGQQPIRYSDSITGRDGQPVPRQWTVYPGASGFGGQSTQVLLFDLL